ncbi:MAG: DUF1365 domain-containing protein [Verrucomicrobiota bacterium]
MRRSCLYECTVMHRRILPKNHEFAYRIFLFLLDLDELAELENKIPVFSFDGPNLYSLRSADYFQYQSGAIRENLMIFLRSEGFEKAPAGVRLLTLPRLLGYTFNPISIFFCYDESGLPMTSVVQVGNTFGELKPYLVPLEGGRFHVRVRKNFYVSPFSDLDLAFDFRIDIPGDRLRVLIDDYSGDDKTLLSALSGTRRELTLGSLLFLTLKYPLVTLKIIALIHWEALRLWLKGIPHRLKESDPHLQTGVFRAKG